jgi:hypothetical protein
MGTGCRAPPPPPTCDPQIFAKILSTGQVFTRERIMHSSKMLATDKNSMRILISIKFAYRTVHLYVKAWVVIYWE